MSAPTVDPADRGEMRPSGAGGAGGVGGADGAFDPLLPRGVAVVWFLALLAFAAGLAVGALAGAGVAVPGTSILSLAAVLLGVTGQAMLYARRGYDALDRLQRRATASVALASTLAAGGIVALIVFGPERPIGTITAVAAAGVMAAAGAAAASTSVLIRPHVEAMPAHVWAGIGGAGLAVPFMVAGADPTLIVALALALAVYDRWRGRRTQRDVEARIALSESIDRRDLPVRGLPGTPLVTPTRPARPWSRRERRLTIALGVAALLTVVGAFIGGALLGDATPDLVAPGQGLAVTALGAVPLLVQIALLLRVAAPARRTVIVTGAVLVAASLAVLIAPTDAVVLVAWAVQSVAAGVATARITRMLVSGTALGQTAIVVTVALAWWALVVTSGGIALAFGAVVTTLLAVRRRANGIPPAA